MKIREQSFFCALEIGEISMNRMKNPECSRHLIQRPKMRVGGNLHGDQPKWGFAR